MSNEATDGLTVFGLDGSVTQVLLRDGRFTIGRDKRCDLRLEHPSVSRQHARLVPTDTSWFISDLYSRNGTLLNGRRIRNEWVRYGDFIRIGAYKLRVGAMRDDDHRVAEKSPRAEDTIQLARAHPHPDRAGLRRYYEEFPSARLEGDYARLWSEIFRLWGTPAGERYLRTLVYTERVDREGFPLDIMSELLCLLQIQPKGMQPLAV
jgi:pSer/pThr/pTyr-binding forkhead associated (FHA) protein